jgi:hypothetical protein
MSNYFVTDTLRWSNDAEKNCDSLSYVKLKEIKLNQDLPVCRIKFDLKSAGTVHYAYAQIYKNGVAIGTAQSTYGTTYLTKSEDFTGFKAGDLIQIYAKEDAVSWPAFVQNFRLYFDYGINKAGGYDVTNPILTTWTFTTNPTNQDPA